MHAIGKLGLGMVGAVLLGGACQVIAGVDTHVKLEEAGTPCQNGTIPPGGILDDSQTDCIDFVCHDGQLVEQPDDTEVPDDGLVCTTDACKDGEESFQPTPGAGCGDGGVLMCNDSGQCVGCVTANDCGVDSECRIWECHTDHTCGAMDPPQGTPVVDQTVGDCQKKQCNGVGGEETVQDATDVLEDGNECTDDVCDKTMPSSTNSPKDTLCGNGYCDGNGTCVQCNDPTQCAMGTSCQTRTCTNGTCGVSNTMDGTPLPSGQMAGDCQEVQCDGNGGTKTANSDNDLPVDGNDCTVDICLGGAPLNPNAGLGTMCNQNGGQACDGNGACKKQNGTLCIAGSACATGNCTDGVCCDQPCLGQCYSCNQTNNVGKCLLLPGGQEDPNSTPPCSGTKACTSAGFCVLKDGQACAMGNQCISGNCVDGVCCNSTCTGTCKACNVIGAPGVCTDIPKNNEDNFPVSTCAGTKACNGVGACLLKDGQSCMMNNECVSGKCQTNVCIP